MYVSLINQSVWKVKQQSRYLTVTGILHNGWLHLSWGIKVNYKVKSMFSFQIPFIWRATHTYWTRIVLIIFLLDWVLAFTLKGQSYSYIMVKLKSVPYPISLDNPLTTNYSHVIYFLSNNHCEQWSTNSGISRRRPYWKIADYSHQGDSRSIIRPAVCSPLKYLSFDVQHIHIEQNLLK